jgi:hypothetical protein
MNPSSSDIDWKTIGWFVGGILIGAFLAAPMIAKMTNKKGKKPESTASTKP